MRYDKELAQDLEWCRHIHNWGNAFYFVDTHNPFNVDERYLDRRWCICPVCKTPRPKMRYKEPTNE